MYLIYLVKSPCMFLESHWNFSEPHTTHLTNKNNLNDYNIMKLSLCQKRRVVNKLFLSLLLPYLCNYIFPNDVILKEVFFFSFSFFYFRCCV